MKYVVKDIIESFNKVRLENKKVTLLWTSNTSVTPKGNAVMGAGLAKQMIASFKGIKHLESLALSKMPKLTVKLDKYNNNTVIKVPRVHTVYSKGNASIMAFPVKHGYWEQAQLPIIKQSAIQLASIAKKNPDTIFMINFPGIGAGRLEFDDVQALIKPILDLPNIYIFLKNKQVK